MGYARAVVAGVLSAALTVDLLTQRQQTMTEQGYMLWILLAAVIVLLVIPDVLEQWQRSRRRR